MCSTNNTIATNNHHGGGGDDADGGRGDSSPTTSSSKKIPQKLRKRVPKRGPGVAELEKILREQQKNNTTSCSQGHFSPFVSSSSSTSDVVVDHYLPQPHHQRYFPLIPNSGDNDNKDSNYSLANNNNNNNNNKNNKNCVNGMVGRYVSGGAGGFLPKMNATYGSITTTFDEGFVSSMMMNDHFPGSSLVPVSSLRPQPIEPPSSQRSLRNYTTVGSQQQKFVEAKRALPVESNQYEASLLPSNRKQRTEKMSASSSHGVGLDSNICKPMQAREAKWDGLPRECDYMQSYNAEVIHGVADANFVRFISPTSAAPVLTPFQAAQHPLPNKFDMVPFQGGTRECLNHKSTGMSDPNKPAIFSFFPSNDHQRVTNLGLFDMKNIEKGNKSGQDGIDLNLKLSTS